MSKNLLFQNCQTECEAKLYLKYCDCVLYYLPRFSDDVAICGRKDTECVNSVARSLQAKVNASFQCDCLPGCFAVNSYNIILFVQFLLDSSI